MQPSHGLGFGVICHGSGNAEDPETKMPIGRCTHPYAPLIKCYAA